MDDLSTRPGWKTSEAILSALAMIVSYISTLDLPQDAWWVKIIAALAAMLSALGYTWSRTRVKETQAKATVAHAEIMARPLVPPRTRDGAAL